MPVALVEAWARAVPPTHAVNCGVRGLKLHMLVVLPQMLNAMYASFVPTETTYSPRWRHRPERSHEYSPSLPTSAWKRHW